MATTTNYSWTTPDDTDLVKDGASAIRTLGSAIDTTVFNNAAAAVAKSTIDAKGDLLVGTADDTVGRLAVGTDGYTLVADSSVSPTGLKWAVDPVADVVTTAGDLLYATAADTVARLGIGTAGQVLTVNSGATAPEWAAAGGGGMTLIQALTLSGASTTSSSIAGTYKHLFIVVKDVTIASGNGDMSLRLNSDTGNNYFRTRILFQSTLSGAVNTGVSSIALSDVSTSAGAGEKARGNIWIPRYTDTDETYITSEFYVFQTVQQGVWANSVYNNSAAITSITLNTSNSTFSTGTAYIYGVS